MKLSASFLGALCSTVPCCAVVMQREPQRGSLSVRSAFAKTAVSTTALLELEDQLDKMAVGTVDPTGDLLGEVGNLIRETMMPGIVSSHNSTQQQLNGFAAAFNACPDPKYDASVILCAYTSTAKNAETSGTVSVRSKASGDWGEYQTLFEGASQGAEHCLTMGVNEQPTAIELSISNNNGWGFWKITVDGCVIKEDSKGSGGSAYGNNPFWLDGDQDAPRSQQYNVDCQAPDSCQCLTCGPSGSAGTFKEGICAAKDSVAGKACTSGNRKTSGCVSSLDEYACHCPGTVGERTEGTDITTAELIQTTLGRRRNRRRNRRRATTTTTTMDPVLSQFAQVAACRVREGVAATASEACQSGLIPVETAKNSSCHALKNLQTTPVPATLCTPTDPYDQWLISTNAQVGDMKKHLGALKDGCGNATQLFNDKVAECGAAKAALDGNKTSCDELQTAAEAAICVVVGPDSQRCTAYETCYNNAVSAYTDENATIVEMQLNWTVQWRTLKRMECLLDIMAKGGTNDDIDACKDKLWDTTWLDLDYPAIPPKKECAAAAKRPAPCEQSFLTKHYGGNPANAPAAACVPCATVETTTAPAIPPTVYSTTNADAPWDANEAARAPWGGSGGSPFNDFASTAGRPIYVFCAWHGSMIDAIQLKYWTGGMSPKHGGSGGAEDCFVLEKNEVITTLNVRSGGGVDGLLVVTSNGRTKKWGGDGGSSHTLEFAGKHLVSIFGSAGGMLDSIGAVFGDDDAVVTVR